MAAPIINQEAELGRRRLEQRLQSKVQRVPAKARLIQLEGRHNGTASFPIGCPDDNSYCLACIVLPLRLADQLRCEQREFAAQWLRVVGRLRPTDRREIDIAAKKYISRAIEIALSRHGS